MKTFLLSSVVLLSIGFTLNCSAATYDVPAADVVALTNALKNAKSGDVVSLAAGTYDLTPLQENVMSSPMNYSTYYGPSMLYISAANVTLKGATGNPDDVILTADDAKLRLLRIGGKNSSVRDLTLLGGYASSVSNDYYNLRTGGALMFTESGQFASNCVFVGNTAATRGGAVSGPNAMKGTVYDSVFRGNNGSSESLIASGTTLKGCVITNNVTGASIANYGVRLTSGCRLHDCLVADNETRYAGVTGGFAVGCRFINNHAASENWSNPGGGAARDAALTNCYFYGNRAYRLGGAIRGGTVVNCVVVSNTVTRLRTDNDCYGAGIYLANHVENCTVMSNYCGRGAGISGITDDGVAYTVFVTNSYIAYNVARQYGGGSHLGALNGCTVEHNISMEYANANYGGGGGGLSYGSATNCVFRDNSCSATYNSSVVYNCDIFDTSMHAKVIDRCRIANVRNEPIARAVGAVGYPDGYVTSNIYMIGFLEMRNCLITNCNWRSVPGHFVNSAMFHSGYSGAKRVENCTISDNYFYILARGFDAAANSCTFANCAIIGNRSTDVNMMDQGSVVLSNCVYSTTNNRFFLDGFSDGQNWRLPSVADARFCGAKADEWDAFYYTPRYTSSLRGKGLVFDWMAGCEDIAGNPRLREGLADIGAHQCWIKPPWTTIVVR